MSPIDDELAIRNVLGCYADVVNRRAWSELDGLFRPDATVAVDTMGRPLVELTGPRSVGDFIGRAIERFEFFEFVVLNAVVDLEPDAPDRAAARVFMCEIRKDRPSGDWSTAFGVYHNRYRRIEGRWWFARRAYQSLARTETGEVFPFPERPRFV